MATISEVRDALAELLRTGLDLRYASGRVPSPLQPSTVFVVPQAGTDYVSWDATGAGGSFCRPTVALSAIVVGATTNISTAAAWLDEAIEKVPAALAADQTLTGRCSALVLVAVTEPGLLTVEQGGNYLSAELRFRPLTISPNP